MSDWFKRNATSGEFRCTICDKSFEGCRCERHVTYMSQKAEQKHQRDVAKERKEAIKRQVTRDRTLMRDAVFKLRKTPSKEHLAHRVARIMNGKENFDDNLKLVFAELGLLLPSYARKS
jgi:hypothetical protein